MEFKTTVLAMFVFVANALWLASFTDAQNGMSSMSVGASRSNIPMRAEDIRVEEFVNYHRHKIPVPDHQQSIAMSLTWLKKGKSKGLLQIGLATPSTDNLERMPDANIVLVIDQSGSMHGTRMNTLKQALRELVSRLRPQDKLSIVCFNKEAAILFAGKSVKNKSRITNKIDTIQAAGSTNLHAGLKTGYEIALEHFSPNKSNRVVLLTDGQANVGITDPEQIKKASGEYNKKGIGLSTIGLGSSFNMNLLRTLADTGKGQAHFIADDRDIEKTFQKELDSILASCITNVSLRVSFKNPKTKVKIFGYKRHSRERNVVTIPIDDLNFGSTSVVLMTTSLPPEIDNQVEAVLIYKKYLSKSLQKISVHSENAEPPKLLKNDHSVRKNYSIALLASSWKQSIGFLERNQNLEAERILRKGLAKARKHQPISSDIDIQRVRKKCDRLLRTLNHHKKELAKSRSISQ